MLVLDILKGFAPALVGVVLVSHLCGILARAAAMAGLASLRAGSGLTTVAC